MSNVHETERNLVIVPVDIDKDDGGYSIETKDGRRVAFIWNYVDTIPEFGAVIPHGSRDPKALAEAFAAATQISVGVIVNR